MFTISYDAAPFISRMSDVEKRQFPFALANALNDTAFQVRAAWRDEIPKIFDRPVSLTLNAVLYRKATKQNPVAEVFIRDHVSRGVPPSKYLLSEVTGGTRRAKASEVLLRKAGVLGGGEFWVPGRAADLDAGGNVPGKTIRTILADLQATFDPLDRSTPASRKKRSRRKAIGKRAVYFYSRGPSGDRGDGRPQHLPRGIYERTRTAFGSSLESVLHVVSGVHYGSRYDVTGLARRLFNARFVSTFNAWMVRALAGRL